MKRFLILSVAITSMFLSLINPLAFQPLVHASSSNVPASWQKGMSVRATNPEDFASISFQQSMQKLALTHINYVTLIIQTYQVDITSTEIYPGQETTSDAALISGINYIHSLGLNVMLKFHVDPQDGAWRAYINPVNRTAWFTSYGNMLNHFAKIAAQTNVEQICLGAELTDMASSQVNQTNTKYWITLIKNIRTVYFSAVIYNANDGSEALNIGFWSYLDNIGISAYIKLADTPNPTVSTLENGWANVFSDIQLLHTKFNKNIIFSEVGFRSISGVSEHPWDWSLAGTPNQTEQANNYTALFDYWSKYSWMIGVHLWYWESNPNGGGTQDTNYTPQRKTAQSVLTHWFGNGLQTNPNFSLTQVSFIPMSPSVNQPVTLKVTVQNTGGNSSNVNADFELYNSANVQVLQKIFSGESFFTNGSKVYTFAWTPSASDSYTLKVGLFSNDWSQNFYWNNTALQFKVGSSLESVAVWWPTNGSSLSGIQPFKALIASQDLTSYVLYWQVDNGMLNIMNNVTDPDHKEVLVDVSKFGKGIHNIQFTAKDTNGKIVAQQSINITASL